MRVPEGQPASPVRRLTGILVIGYTWFFLVVAFLFGLLVEFQAFATLLLAIPGIVLIAIAMRVTAQRGLPVTWWSLGAGIGGLVPFGISIALSIYASSPDGVEGIGAFLLRALVSVPLIVAGVALGARIGRRLDERRSA